MPRGSQSGLVQLKVPVRPAQKRREGRNPATGEEIEVFQRSRQASSDRLRRPKRNSHQFRKYAAARDVKRTRLALASPARPAASY